jgi:hypothetical protein
MPGRGYEVHVVLVRGEREVGSWTLTYQGRPDLVLVDELARLQLVAGRMGCAIRLRQPGPFLSQLLDLAGLGEVIAEVGPGLKPDLAGQVQWQAEGGEQVGVEEGMESGDPSA